MKIYDIGIDLGTHSSAVAVVGDDLKLKKYKGKNVWSVMKFDKAETAASTRIFRGTRRVIDRRKQRIVNFQQLIEEEILKIDKHFFLRLRDSFKHLEDRNDKENKYNLFIDKNFNDKEYYKQYPTIYHLRRELVNSKEKKDIRLIYLAIHHILKYRGNFLFEGQSFSEIVGNNEELIEVFIESLEKNIGLRINSDVKEILLILQNKKISNKDKILEISKIEKYEKDELKKLKEIFNGIVGLQFTLSKIYDDTDFGEVDKLKMSDEEIDEKLNLANEILQEEDSILIKMKAIYSALKLNEVLNGESYISESMINKYESFGEDLKLLKKVIKKYLQEDYSQIFKSKKEDEVNYYNYINNNIKVKAGEGITERRKKFYNLIKSKIENIESEDCKIILSKIANESFLIKQNTTINSYIPYQVHEMELEKILNNQSEYYQSLKECKDKILSILTFRIPYYVGPLGKYGRFKWMQRKEGMEKEKIYPWNFKQVVDIDKSAEQFITRMTSFCSYIPSETIIPLNSILYTEYLYYNEVNKIRFSGKMLNSDFKEKLKAELFMKKRIVTKQDLVKWYKQKMPMINEIEVTGFMGDEKVAVTLKSIIDFTKIYGKITKDNIDEIEKIIYWIAVFEDKKIVERKLQNETNLTQDSIKKVLSLKYKGWGKLSKRLLTNIKGDSANYRGKSIMEILQETNLNFMQIVNDSNIGINKELEKINGHDKIDKINFEKDIKPLQGSPDLKRAIYQSVKQIDEIIKIMGNNPRNIFIEFAREDGESKRTVARAKTLLKIYEEFESTTSKDEELIKELKNLEKIDSERLYLYFMQRGKCLYTDENLEISELFSYEVDHIIPRAIIKDDSFSNKALVTKQANQEKSSGSLTITSNIQAKWTNLLKYKLISRRKYDLLNKINYGFSEVQIKGFINRQLVEVRQITKHVANLLNRAYGENGTKVYSVKAELVDNFKKQFDILKSREINDYHHAKDAYATAVVGSYINKRFPTLNSEFIYDEYIKTYNKKSKNKDLKKEKNKYGFIISSMTKDFIDDETGEWIWDSQQEISKFKKIFKYNDCLVVKKTEVMDGQMFNLTRYEKPNGEKKINLDGKIPLKNNKNEYLSPAKYGYYEGVKESYYSIIEYTEKNKRIKRLVGVPIMDKQNIKNKNDLKKYFDTKYSEVKIIKAKVPKYQKIRYLGHEYYIVSTREWQNAKQLKLNEELYKNICIMNDKRNFNKIDNKEEFLNNLFDELLRKVKQEFSIPYKTIIKKIEDKKELVYSLSLEKKKDIINQILRLTKANSEKGNFKEIKETKEGGKLNGKESVDMNQVTFIYESYLGINVSEE